jgi:predicted pyridoxine 5'-phosphate oxidase superfamily flavin-nucleotide-binding protein
MTHVFHSGEIEIQERAGVSGVARRVAGSVHPSIPPAAADFLAGRTWVVVASADAGGRPWASLLSGPEGFVRAVDHRTVRIRAVPTPGDPLAANLLPASLLGLLAPDLATRRRMRLNGRVELEPDGAILLKADQVYSNCPKYITPRGPVGGTAATYPVHVAHRTVLTTGDQEWIRRADTFFIATINPGEGADASHRGGPAGFIRVEGNRVTWPDYRGNSMFNTLGNLARLPRAGLLIPDWATGRTLQLRGRSELDWDPSHAAAFPGAERLVHLEVDEVVETADAAPCLVSGTS